MKASMSPPTLTIILALNASTLRAISTLGIACPLRSSDCSATNENRSNLDCANILNPSSQPKREILRPQLWHPRHKPPLRLGRDAWAIFNRLRQATNAFAPETSLNSRRYIQQLFPGVTGSKRNAVVVVFFTGALQAQPKCVVRAQCTICSPSTREAPAAVSLVMTRTVGGRKRACRAS